LSSETGLPIVGFRVFQPRVEGKFYIQQNDQPTVGANDSENEENSPNEKLIADDAVLAEVVELEELTEEEVRDRLYLERKIERAFYECGKALKELRNRRLYRSTHKTFEEYCRDRFLLTHRNVNYLIAGSLVVDNLLMGTNGSQIQIQEQTPNHWFPNPTHQ